LEADQRRAPLTRAGRRAARARLRDARAHLRIDGLPGVPLELLGPRRGLGRGPAPHAPPRRARRRRGRALRGVARRTRSLAPVLRFPAARRAAPDLLVPRGL